MSIGIPYMGSKRRLSGRILDYIIAQNPQATHFYDLFGGGGAVSFEALQRKQFEQVHYNELNTGVVELLKKIRKDGVTDEFYRWIDRDTFNKHKGDSDWFGGLLKTCWSFGNNQRCYIFGRDVEAIKYAAHNYLMENGYSKTATSHINLIKKFKEKEKISGFFQAQHLIQLEWLNNLERLENLERLFITNKSYCDVVIDSPPETTIIYCDPPYENTAKYAENAFCHRGFDKWVLEKPYKIYVSGYDSKTLPCVYETRHTTSMNSKQTKPVREKLFCNKHENNFFRLI